MKSAATTEAAGLPLFQGLPPAVVERLLSAARVERCRAGECLLVEGERGETVRIVASGLIGLCTTQPRPETAILILSAGDLVMPAAALFGEPFLTGARALVPSRLVTIASEAVRREMDRCPELALRVARCIGGQWRMAVRHLLDLKSRSAPERLGAFLLRLVDESPFESTAELPIPKRHLAARLGIAAETLSRALQSLAEHGLLLRGRRIIVRDRAKAEAFCGPDPYPGRSEAGLLVGAY